MGTLLLSPESPKARTAYATASRAFNFEWENENVMAGAEWQELFGSMIALYVS